MLVLVPALGTRFTFLLFAFVLLIFSLVGVRQKIYRGIYALFIVILVILWRVIRPGAVRSVEGLIWEGDSVIQFIQIVDDPDRGRRLLLNEGYGTHSIYDPDRLLTDGPWDYFLLAPFLGGQTKDDADSLLIIGLGAGTVSKQFTAVYGGDVLIDGVELDPKVVELGRRYFDMNEPNLNAIAADGRTYLQHSENRYDVIAADAYRQPYIPFHLTTREFFEDARDHLKPDGVFALNAGRTSDDFRLVEAIASTMRAVFPYVYVIDLPSSYANSLVYGASRPISDMELRSAAMEAARPRVCGNCGTSMEPAGRGGYERRLYGRPGPGRTAGR